MIAARLPDHVDILIVGGGPVGALLAQRLAGSAFSTLLVEARPAAQDDPRALALSFASQTILDNTGLWDASLAASPIESVHVSQQGTLGRLALNAAELDLPQLGCVVGYGALATHLRQCLIDGPAAFATAEVTELKLLDGYAQAKLLQNEHPHLLTARQVVLADGGRLASQLPGLRQHTKPYHQHAILALLTPASPHHNTAWERFADDGPLALLPYGEQLALVWTQSPEKAAARLAMQDADFLTELNAQLGKRAPELIAVGPRSSFPLALKTMSKVVGKRCVLIGNAAQTLHPVAGQGLNLGLRDADTLAQLLIGSDPLELGTPAQLDRYARLRRSDTGAVIGFTDGLIELFRPDFAPLKHARSLGLLALDLVGPARRAVAKSLVFGGR